jgi:hypothetical protein
MQQPRVLYYESHITVEPVFDDGLRRLKAACTPFGFRISQFLLDKRPEDAAGRYDAFCNGRSYSWTELERRMLACRTGLKQAGFAVRRHKIEATLVDSRYDGAVLFPLDRNQLPERELRPTPAVSLEEALTAAEPLPAGVRYWESHVTVEPLSGGPLAAYVLRCAEHGFKPAGILAKTRAADPAVPHGTDIFCTGHGRTCGETETKTLGLLQALAGDGTAIWRYRIEAVVLDTRHGAKH